MAKQEKLERRRYPRFSTGGGVAGRITADQSALVDVSLGGALIEHSQILRPGSRSYLRLILLGRDVSLRCHVVRSAVHRLERHPNGEQTLIYRTSLEFLEHSEETQHAIGNYIHSFPEPALAS